MLRAAPATGPERPQDVVVCDIDGDGKLDILTANSGSEDVSVLLGDGGGGLRPAEIAALSSGDPHNHGLLTIDLDADGDLDIVTTNQAEGSVSVLHGDGQGRFTPAPGSPFPVGRMPYLPAAGDVDGDGRLDLAIPNARDDDVTILLGRADGSVSAAPGSPYSVKGRPYFAGLADLNGDSRLDLVTSHAETSLLTILIGDGTGGFVPASGSPVDAENRGYKVGFGDVNLDGHIDLLTSGGRGVAVLLGEGQGAFAPAPGSPFATGNGSWSLAVADVDSDGHLDIVTANSDDDSASLLLGN